MAACTGQKTKYTTLAVVQTYSAAADRNNCYFIDPTVDWRQGLRADSASGATVFDSAVHRKIRLYVELGDDVDNTGHGTHTMGTLVGSPYDISNVKAVDYRSALAALADPSEPSAAQQSATRASNLPLQRMFCGAIRCWHGEREVPEP